MRSQTAANSCPGELVLTMVRMAGELVTLPAEFVTATVYVPLSPIARLARESEGVVAPETLPPLARFAPFLRH